MSRTTKSQPSPKRDRPKNYKSGLQRARELQLQEFKRLETIPVELQVRDIDHAKSPEVIQFALAHLSTGGTWNELRRKLGLGPSHLDKKWRVIRHLVTEGLLPENEEEALQAQASMRTYLLSKIEDFLGDVESKLLAAGDAKSDHHFMKLRLESLKVLLEENKESFNAYVLAKKLKHQEKTRRGVSILVQNNYHIARPGQDAQALKDVTEKAIGLIEQAEGEEDGE
jgi:hypothetical protein